VCVEFLHAERLISKSSAVPRLAAMTVYYIFMILLSMAIRLFNRCCCGRTAEDLATPTMHVAHTLQNWVNGNLFQMCICETVIMIKSPHKATFRGLFHITDIISHCTSIKIWHTLVNAAPWRLQLCPSAGWRSMITSGLGWISRK